MKEKQGFVCEKCERFQEFEKDIGNTTRMVTISIISEDYWEDNNGKVWKQNQLGSLLRVCKECSEEMIKSVREKGGECGNQNCRIQM